VLWLRWKNDPVYLLDKDTAKQVQKLSPSAHPSDELRDNVKNQLKKRVTELPGPTLGAVASIYSLLRVGETAR
jgi:hypothetical protein